MVILFDFICQQDGKEEKLSESGEVECLVNVCSLTTVRCHFFDERKICRRKCRSFTPDKV